MTDSFVDEAGIQRLRGKASGGGGAKIDRLDIPVSFAVLGTAAKYDLSTLDGRAVLNASDILLGSVIEVVTAFNDSAAATIYPEVDIGDPDGAYTAASSNGVTIPLAHVIGPGDFSTGVIDMSALAALAVFPSGSPQPLPLIQASATPQKLYYGSGATPLAGDGTAGLFFARFVIVRA